MAFLHDSVISFGRSSDISEFHDISDFLAYKNLGLTGKIFTIF